MCGIVGFVGSPRAAEYVLEGLRKLEYRGYDSAGIATIDGGEIQLRRRQGKLAGLTELLAKEPLRGNIAIGHTRWATHGRPSEENAHPHRVDDIVLVHNGIIENYQALRQALKAKGRTFLSETDTEIISHLVAIAPQDTLEARVRHALSQTEGAFAVAVISTRQPDTIVAAKNASPLVLGFAPEIGLLASDIPAILPHTREVMVLGEGELAVIRPGSVELSTLAGAPVAARPRTIEWSPVMAEKGGHKHFMHKEMHEQPRSVIDTLRGRIAPDNGDVLADEEMLQALARAKQVMFTACGTSYHACLSGRLMFEELARVHCETELASELRYRHPLLGPDTVVIAVSQSGETADTLAAIKAARALGAKVLSVVNVIDSSISRESDFTFYTHAGPEIGVASTKAFITQVAALSLLAVGAARRRKIAAEQVRPLLAGLRQMPLLIQEALGCEAAVLAVAHKIHRAPSALFLGRSHGYPVALEGALKLKEISYIHAEGYAAGEMKHGPIALIARGVPVVVVCTQGPLYDKTISNAQEVRAREAHVVAVATQGDSRIAEVADDVLFVPAVDPRLAAMVATIPLQLLSYHVADLRGTDVDQPRNLAKSVTVE